MRPVLVYADQYRMAASNMIKTKKQVIILLLLFEFVLFVALLLML